MGEGTGEDKGKRRKGIVKNRMVLKKKNNILMALYL